MGISQIPLDSAPRLPGPALDLFLRAEAALRLIAAVRHVDRVDEAGALPSVNAKDQQPAMRQGHHAPWPWRAQIREDQQRNKSDQDRNDRKLCHLSRFKMI